MQVDADFPGGNAIIKILEDGEIEIRPDLRDTIGNWFYWCFRVRGCGGKRLRVRIGDDSTVPIGVRGPAVRTDSDPVWRWLGASQVVDGRFEFFVPPSCDEVYFSFGMGYTNQDLERFLTRFKGHSGLTRHELTRSEEGRRVEMLKFGRTEGAPTARVLLTCRHHSCEMMASYVLEGLIEYVLDPNDLASNWLSEHVEFVAVPFVDTDGVEAGDQGKNRAPHDHGRDYGPGEGIYASVRAIRDLVRDALDIPFNLVLDLHCPNISGPTNERIYFVGSPDPDNWLSVQLLAKELERRRVGPLPYSRANDLPFGTAWNVAQNFVSRDGRSAPQQSIGWFLDDALPEGTHAILEFPYANVEGQEVNAMTARDFGSDLARAIQAFLQAGHQPRTVNLTPPKSKREA